MDRKTKGGEENITRKKEGEGKGAFDKIALFKWVFSQKSPSGLRCHWISPVSFIKINHWVTFHVSEMVKGYLECTMYFEKINMTGLG